VDWKIFAEKKITNSLNFGQNTISSAYTRLYNLIYILIQVGFVNPTILLFRFTVLFFGIDKAA
jgi:hypothetical protein